jgi:hypothetical protein
MSMSCHVACRLSRQTTGGDDRQHGGAEKERERERCGEERHGLACLMFLGEDDAI